MTNKTIEYYNNSASVFVSDTINVEFSDLQNQFASYLPSNGKILDLGCGAGRDSKAFIERGFVVTAMDGSKELCELASKLIGQEVICSLFEEFETEEVFDGIWACASLLHLDKTEIKNVIKKISKHLVIGGCFYMSFKYGEYSGERNGRFFTDLDEESLNNIIGKIPGLVIDKMFVSSDARPGRENEKWLNAFLIRKG